MGNYCVPRMDERGYEGYEGTRPSRRTVSENCYQGGFPVMAETTRKLAASTRSQFFFVASTTASTRCLVPNFQLICFSQRVNATSQYNNVAVRDVQNERTGWDRCSGEALLDPCTKKEGLQRKITKHYHWIGIQEILACSVSRRMIVTA